MSDSDTDSSSSYEVSYATSIVPGRGIVQLCDLSVSELWAFLIDFVRRDHVGSQVLDLSDGSFYMKSGDCRDSVKMRLSVDDLIEALETSHLSQVVLGPRLLQCLDEDDQERLFRASLGRRSISVFDIGSASVRQVDPSICIHTQALLDAMIETELPNLHQLVLENLRLSTPAQVETLACAIRGNCYSLRGIRLKGIECPVYKKRNRDGPIGLLDSLLSAASESESVHVLKLHSRSITSTESHLISSQALSSLFGPGRSWGEVSLRGLGLNNGHCRAIAQQLSRPDCGRVTCLDLQGNPGITSDGFQAILGILNEQNSLRTIHFDDKNWDAQFNLVANLNDQGRLEALRNGAFDDRLKWATWLGKVCTLEQDEDNDDERVDFVWNTLLEQPNFVYIQQTEEPDK